jgi:hypothetical protein
MNINDCEYYNIINYFISSMLQMYNMYYIAKHMLLNVLIIMLLYLVAYFGERWVPVLDHPKKNGYDLTMLSINKNYLIRNEQIIDNNYQKKIRFNFFTKNNSSFVFIT